MGIKADDFNAFKIRKGKKEIKSKNYWASVRIKTDDETSEKYIDILIGKKYEKAHVHYGLKPDQTLLFVKSPTGRLLTVSRDVKIKKFGKTISEQRDEVMYKSGKLGARLTFVVDINVPAKTIEVKLRELALSEK